MADDKKDNLVDVENMEITALDDKELESVSGGITNNTVASCSCCVKGATEALA